MIVCSARDKRGASFLCLSRRWRETGQERDREDARMLLNIEAVLYVSRVREFIRANIGGLVSAMVKRFSSTYFECTMNGTIQDARCGTRHIGGYWRLARSLHITRQRVKYLRTDHAPSRWIYVRSMFKVSWLHRALIVKFKLRVLYFYVYFR